MIAVSVDPFRSGKSERLVAWMREAPDGVKRVLVSHSFAVSSMMWRWTREQQEKDPSLYKLENWQFVHYQLAMTQKGMFQHRGVVELALDDTEIVLDRIFSQGKAKMVRAQFGVPNARQETD